MVGEGYTNSSLAAKMNVSYQYIYKFTGQEKPITRNFKWLYGERLGWQLAARLFNEEGENQWSDHEH
jgi:hypothetical protein